MMQRVTRLTVVASMLVALSGGIASADNYAPRQYYSDWKKAPQGNYYVRHYYAKPTPKYSGYRTHEVRYFPAKPDHYYYYNPKVKKYWGRCPSQHNGEGSYSLLKNEDRHADLNRIPEQAFPPPSAPPPIPESDPAEGAQLDLPPDDAPPIGATPAP